MPFLLLIFSGWPRFRSVRSRFGGVTVRAVPVFGSGAYSSQGVFCVSVQFNKEGRFRFRFMNNGSGSAFGSWENGSDGSGFRFRFGSWATLFFSYALKYVVVLNAVVCRNTQMSAKEMSAKERIRKRAQKGAKERKRALPCKKWQTTRFKTTRFGNSQYTSSFVT